MEIIKKIMFYYELLSTNLQRVFTIFENNMFLILLTPSFLN